MLEPLMAAKRNVLSAARHELRNANLQQARRAIVAASSPLRRITSSLARSQTSSAPENRPIWGVREVGDFRPHPANFGETMPVRPYDQSTVVVSIDGGRATFRNGHALDSERRVLYENQLSFGVLPIALQRLEQPVATFDSVAYLSNTGANNFYHWFLLVLPMLRFYKKAGIDAERFYVGEPLSAWQKRSLDFVGLQESSIVTRPCRAEVGHVAVMTRHLNGVPPEQVRWARAAFVPVEPPPGKRKYFVGRGPNATTRSMIGEKLIAETLEREFGFEYITTSDMTLDQEMSLFADAEAIVGPGGAALTNILFAPTGTKVLELQAFDNDFSLSHCFQEMSAVLGNPHGLIRGQPTRRRRRGLLSDILIPPEQVLREVEKMLAD